MFKTIEWKNSSVVLLDQRKLPHEEVYLCCRTYQEVANAIKTMVVRGAPAIGVTASMGVALGALSIQAKNFEDFASQFNNICTLLHQTRPTAVNLDWALLRMKKYMGDHRDVSLEQLKKNIVLEAQKIALEDVDLNQTLGQIGQSLIENDDCILTHCNAGALATAGYGTALGVIYAAVQNGKKIEVYADETRPFLQGARLTAWELQKKGIPVTLITDNMAGWFMKKNQISKVIVGADRIAANGDVANKIGTYSVAVLANRHQIPFYVAAPLSTIDFETKTGDLIPIEERSITEITHFQGIPIAPEGIGVKNPAFDVTPAELVSAIITEKGIARAPYGESLNKIKSQTQISKCKTKTRMIYY